MSDSAILLGIGAATFGVTILAYLKAGGVKRTLTTQYYGLPLLVLLIGGGAYGGLLAHEFGYLSEEMAWAVRFTDWMLAAPLLVYYLGLLAGVGRGARAGLVAVGMGTVAAGYAALRTTGTTQWAAYAVSVLLFLLLAGLLLRSVSRAATARFGSRESRSLFESLRTLIVFVLALYPVTWALGPGLDLLRHGDQVFFFLVLDLSSKVGFASVIAFRQYALEFVRQEGPTEVASGGD